MTPELTYQRRHSTNPRIKTHTPYTRQERNDAICYAQVPLGCRQTEIAAFLGLHPSTVSEAIRGHRGSSKIDSAEKPCGQRLRFERPGGWADEADGVRRGSAASIAPFRRVPSRWRPPGERQRTLVVGEHHTLLPNRRQAMQTQAFQAATHHRNAIEGTQSELVRGYGLRRARYRGRRKVRLQNYMIAAACNIRRWCRRTLWEAGQAANNTLGTTQTIS